MHVRTVMRVLRFLTKFPKLPPWACVFTQTTLIPVPSSSGTSVPSLCSQEFPLHFLQRRNFFPSTLAKQILSQTVHMYKKLCQESAMLLCQTTPDRDVKQSRTANKVISTYPGHFMRQHFQPRPVSRGIPSETKTASGCRILIQGGCGASCWGKCTSVMDTN